MARYTINIGNDFPLGDDNEPGYNGGHGGPGHNSGNWRLGRRQFRAATVLRVVFLLAVAAIIFAHPVKVALLVGVLLLIRRAPWFVEFRERAREALRRAWPEAAQRMEAWRAQRWGAAPRADAPAASDRDDDDHGEDGRRGYRGFV